MDKKDIYEHLASIYLDASRKKNKKRKETPRIFKQLFLASLALIIILSALLVSDLSKTKPYNSQTTLVLLADSAKINFNFNPAKKEIFTLDLKKIDLTRFKTLSFDLKKANFRDTIALRVEFTSLYKEKSEIYIKEVSPRWTNFKMKLADFKNISDWSKMLALNFIVEEWNVKTKDGLVYVDNVCLIR